MTKPRFFKTPSTQPKQKESSIEKTKNPHPAGKLVLGIGPKVSFKTITHFTKTAMGRTPYQKFVRAKIAAVLLFGVGIGIASNGVSAVLNHHDLPSDVAAKAANYALINGYPTLNGNYLDCNGNVDNDMGHHVLSTTDKDPAHHVGQNCPTGSVIAQASAGQSGTTQASAPEQTVSQPVSSPSIQTSNTTSCGQVGTDKFVGCYFGAKGFNNLKLIRTDNQVNFDWGNGTPDGSLPSDNFSAIWQGSFNFNNAPYSFQATADDGFRVSVDGNTIIDKMIDQPPTTYNAVANLTAGRHMVKVEYYENTGGATAKLNWTQGASVPVQAALTSSSPAPSSNTAGNVFSGSAMYVDPYMNAKRQADAWRNSRPSDAAFLDKIASQPNAFWFGGWNNDVQTDAANVANAAAAKGQVPVMIIYNIPNRDCGGYSAGGAQTPDAYKNFVSAMARGIGNNKAAVIVEPDGLANIDCMSSGDQQTRMQLVSYAVNAFKSLPNTAVYIDAGNPHWISADEMAKRLNSAGVNQASGFALNVSNFFTTSDNVNFGTQLSSKVGGKHFIVDTSRNGNGPTQDYQWCNPPGRALGSKPTSNTGNNLVDAFVWAKEPGGSDGNCNGGPSAGQWWADYAVGLAQRAPW